MKLFKCDIVVFLPTDISSHYESSLVNKTYMFQKLLELINFKTKSYYYNER